MDLSAFLLGIVASFIAAVLFAIIFAVFIKIKTGIGLSATLIKYVIKFYKRLANIGFSNFYASRADYFQYRGAARVGDYLALAQQKIVLVSLWMAHGVEIEGAVNQLKELIEERPALRVEITLLDPNSVVLEPLSTYINISASEIKARITSALEHLNEMKESLNENDQLRFDLRTYDSLPTFSSILLDPDSESCRIQVDIKVYQEARHNSFAFEFKGHGKYMYELLANAAQRQFFNSFTYEASPEEAS